MLTFFSTHSGAGGACLGARDAGLQSVGGVEIDSYCVDLHRANFGDGIRYESILDTVTEELPDFDFLWTSPSCQKFSGSNRDGGETALDIAISHKLAEIINRKRPRSTKIQSPKNSQIPLPSLFLLLIQQDITFTSMSIMRLTLACLKIAIALSYVPA